MKFEAKKIKELGQGVWTVIIDGADWESAVKKGKNRAAANLSIPGFRKGHVPPEKAAKYLFPSKYLNEAFKVILEPAWNFAKEQKSEITFFNSPIPNPKRISEKECEIEFVFDLKPNIKIGEYKGLKSKDLVKTKVEATKEEIDAEINRLSEKFIMEKEKPEGSKIAKGDKVKFDFEGFVDGVAFPGGKGLDFVLEIGSKKMIPGFEDAMIGHTLGKSEITVTFPKDYTPELSEKESLFKLDIKEIKERILPKKDDELVKDLAIKGVNSIAELEKHIEKQIIDAKSSEVKNIFVNKVIDEIRKTSELEIPKAAITKEVENLYKEFEAKVQSQKMTIKEYKKSTGLSDEAIRKELFNDAKKRLESYLITDEVRNKEKLTVEPAEVDAKYEQLAASFGIDKEMLKSSFLPEESIKEEIIKIKIVDFLYTNNG